MMATRSTKVLGVIRNDPYCVCGVCEQEILALNPRRPAEDLRGYGWRLTRKHGWVCKECCQKENPE